MLPYRKTMMAVMPFSKVALCQFRPDREAFVNVMNRVNNNALGHGGSRQNYAA